VEVENHQKNLEDIHLQIVIVAVNLILLGIVTLMLKVRRMKSILKNLQLQRVILKIKVINLKELELIILR
jgi:hypothetical protein